MCKPSTKTDMFLSAYICLGRKQWAKALMDAFHASDFLDPMSDRMSEDERIYVQRALAKEKPS